MATATGNKRTRGDYAREPSGKALESRFSYGLTWAVERADLVLK
jgi:hypothetical protein